MKNDILINSEEDEKNKKIFTFKSIIISAIGIALSLILTFVFSNIVIGMIGILVIGIFVFFVAWDLGIRYKSNIDPRNEAIYSIYNTKFMKYKFSIGFDNIKKIEVLNNRVNRSIIFRIYWNIKRVLIFPSWHYMNPVLLELYRPIKLSIEYHRGYDSQYGARLKQDPKDGTIETNAGLRSFKYIIISDMENSIVKEYEKYQRRKNKKTNAVF